MAKQKVDYSDLSLADLMGSIKDEKSKLNIMKFNHVINPIDNHNVLRLMRQEIARLNTELSARRNRGELK